MTNLLKLIRDERGVALPLAMILLMVLTMLTITFLSLGQVEPQISRNLSDGARARQLAESGLEWAMSTQIANNDFNGATMLGGTMTSGGSCGTGVTCRVLVTAGTLPGMTSSQGTFAVTLRNDLNTHAGDQALIGTSNTIDTSATNDLNGIVILAATGTFNGASRTVTAVVQRGNLNIQAALSLPGVQSDTFTSDPPCGSCYSIDGRNWNIADTSSPTGSGVKLGIATCQAGAPCTGTGEGALTYEQNAEAGFDDAAKRSYVQGLDAPSGSVNAADAAGTGTRTIAASTSVNPTAISTFLSNLSGNPQTQVINSTQACQYASGSSSKPEGLRMTSTSTANQVHVTNNCTGASKIDQTLNLGTSTSPALVYIKGEYDPTSNFIGASVSGSQTITGYGILVMEEADLSFFQTSQFTWNGIVIVTGRNVGVGFRGGSNTEIRGALLANETNGAEAGGYFEFLNQSSTMKIRYGQQAINLALRGLYNTRVAAYRES